MLILKPPYYNIEGMTLLPDHANENQWYFMPADPAITTKLDPTLDQQVPQISLLKYRGEVGTGGFLNFDVNLGFPEEKLDKVRSKLKSLAALDGEPMLAPVPLVDGSVRMIMLGKASDDEIPEDGEPDDEGPKFVEKIAHAAKPSLYGSNQAIFSVSLDENGVQMMDKALDGELLPIGIVYSLEFNALRPAYNVSVVAEWGRVQEHFEESFDTKVVFVQAEIDEVVDELVESKVIQINVDTFIPEDDDEDLGFVGRRDRALNDFKDMVLQTFFQPSLEPITTEEEDDGAIDDFVGGVERISDLGGTSGGLLSFSYKKVDITRIDKKSINFNMSERSAVRRTIYPQAHLSGLFTLLRDNDGTIDKDRFIQEITLDSDWFKRRKLDAHSLVDFTHDSIESINLTAEYDGRPKNILLKSDSISGEASWNSVLLNNKMHRDVEYQYQVNFKGVNSAERPAIIKSPQMNTRADIFEVNPRGEELYYLDDIKIAARGNFPWDKYPSIELHLRYEDELNEIDIKDSVVLKSDNPEHDWKRFRMDKDKSAYQMKLIFRGVDNDDKEVDWQDLDEELFTIGNPRPRTKKVNIVPAVDWAQVSSVMVELEYVDKANDILEEQTFSFSKEASGPKTFSVGLLNPDIRVVGYRVTIIWLNGAITKIPSSKTLENNIIVSPHMKGHRLIEIEADTTNFDDKGIDRVELEVNFEDTEAGLSFADKFRLTPSNNKAVFEFDYANEANDSYVAEQMIFFSNGMTQRTELGELSDDHLLIEID